jgi:hypothetical protein
MDHSTTGNGKKNHGYLGISVTLPADLNPVRNSGPPWLTPSMVFLAIAALSMYLIRDGLFVSGLGMTPVRNATQAHSHIRHIEAFVSSKSWPSLSPWSACSRQGFAYLSHGFVPVGCIFINRSSDYDDILVHEGREGTFSTADLVCCCQDGCESWCMHPGHSCGKKPVWQGSHTRLTAQ